MIRNVNKLPLTILKGEKGKLNKIDVELNNKFISLKKFDSEVIPYNLNKPISKIVVIRNGNE